jgi:GDP-L-fucose synthase
MAELPIGARIYVAGHRGLVGSAISRALRTRGHDSLLERTRGELDLTDAAAVDRFFEDAQPDYVFLAAAKVGGIHANSIYPADFIRENLAIEVNVIHAAWQHRVTKLLFLGSSCIYPKLAPQPISEEALLGGPLEPTNEAYAIAKIAGLKMCEAYRRQHGFNAISLMPTNLYGPGDDFELETSHVVPALIRKAHEAKLSKAPQLEVWGSGTPRREFLHVDDLADAAVFCMAHYDAAEHINVGVGQDITIRELALLICEIVGYSGDVAFDATKPDGTPRKMLNVDRLSGLGWRPRIGLRDGLAETYRWYLEDGGALAAE